MVTGINDPSLDPSQELDVAFAVVNIVVVVVVVGGVTMVSGTSPLPSSSTSLEPWSSVSATWRVLLLKDLLPQSTLRGQSQLPMSGMGRQV